MVKSPINCRVYDVTQLNPLCGFILLRRDYDDVKVEMDIVLCKDRRAIRTCVYRWDLARHITSPTSMIVGKSPRNRCYTALNETQDSCIVAVMII